jgi:hypothetical protein
MLGLAAMAAASVQEVGQPQEPAKAKRPAPKIRWITSARGLPPMAHSGGRGPVKRNKAQHWHSKRLAKKVR